MSVECILFLACCFSLPLLSVTSVYKVMDVFKTTNFFSRNLFSFSHYVTSMEMEVYYNTIIYFSSSIFILSESNTSVCMCIIYICRSYLGNLIASYWLLKDYYISYLRVSNYCRACFSLEQMTAFLQWYLFSLQQSFPLELKSEFEVSLFYQLDLRQSV